MTPHQETCECHDCATVIARLCGEGGGTTEDARWAAGIVRLRRQMGLSRARLHLEAVLRD